jgi:hypothetical protein
VKFHVRYTCSAREDPTQFYDLVLERAPVIAAPTEETIREATELLGRFSFTCHETDEANPFLRELVAHSAPPGYVAMFEIEKGSLGGKELTGKTDRYVAVRNQREDDYHSVAPHPGRRLCRCGKDSLSSVTASPKARYTASPDARASP